MVGILSLNILWGYRDGPFGIGVRREIRAESYKKKTKPLKWTPNRVRAIELNNQMLEGDYVGSIVDLLQQALDDAEKRGRKP